MTLSENIKVYWQSSSVIAGVFYFCKYVTTEFDRSLFFFSRLAAGNPPLMPIYGSWTDCWRELGRKVRFLFFRGTLIFCNPYEFTLEFLLYYYFFVVPCGTPKDFERVLIKPFEVLKRTKKNLF